MKKLILAVALLPLFAGAAPVVGSSAAFDAFMWTTTGGASQTVGYGSGGTLISSPGVPMIDTDGGMPRVTQSGTLKNPSGNPLVVNSAARVTSKGLRDAAFSVIKHGTGPLLLGVALYDLAKAVKYYLTRNPDGSIGYEEEVTTTGTGTVYSFTINGVTSPTFSSQSAACLWFGGLKGSFYFGYPQQNHVPITNSAQSGSWYCAYDVSYSAGTSYGGYIGQRSSWVTTGTGQVTTTQMQARDEAAFLEKIASTSGWPSTSFAEKVIADPVAHQEGKIELSTPTVTGPSTSVGKTTVTNNTTNNTTKTETVTHNHTYQGNTVNTTTVTVSNVVNNATGDTISNETTTTEPDPIQEPTKDVCEKNPDTIGCSKYGTPVASDVLVSETVAVTITPVAFAGAATCPGPINFNVSGHQYAVSYTPLCDKLAVLKYLFLAMAGFVAAYVVASMFKV